MPRSEVLPRPGQKFNRDFCSMCTPVLPLKPQHRVSEPVPSMETHLVIVSVLPLGRFLTSIFSTLSCFPPFSLVPHMTILSEIRSAYPILPSPWSFSYHPTLYHPIVSLALVKAALENITTSKKLRNCSKSYNTATTGNFKCFLLIRQHSSTVQWAKYFTSLKWAFTGIRHNGMITCYAIPLTE